MPRISYPIVFNERSRSGRKIYLLHADSLEITSYGFRKTNTQIIRLRDLSSDYRAVTRHEILLIVVPAIVSLLFGFATVFVYRNFPDVTLLYQTGIYLTGVFSILAILGTPKVNFYEFPFSSGGGVLTVSFEKNMADETRRFLETLINHIEGRSITSDEEAESDPAEPTKSSFKYSTGGKSQLQQRRDFGQVGIVLGILAVGIPYALIRFPGSEGDAFILTLPCMVLGILCSLQALNRPGYSRAYGAIGLVLCLLPLVLHKFHLT